MARTLQEVRRQMKRLVEDVKVNKSTNSFPVIRLHRNTDYIFVKYKIKDLGEGKAPEITVNSADYSNVANPILAERWHGMLDENPDPTVTYKLVRYIWNDTL